MDNTDGRWCPEEDSGILSRLFFTYCQGLVSLGYHKTLDQDDLWSLAKSDKTSVVAGQFQQNLQATEHPEKAPLVSVVTKWPDKGIFLTECLAMFLTHYKQEFTLLCCVIWPKLQIDNLS